jgi:hypothetical protein
MDSEGDARSNSGMHVDSEADEYSDACDYDEYNEGNWFLDYSLNLSHCLEELYGVEDRSRDPPECSHLSSDPESINYECLSVSDVETMVNNWVAEVTELFSISPSQAKLLLQLSNWDLDLIKREANENANEFLTKNGLKLKAKPATTERRVGMELRSKIAKKSVKKQDRCGVCWEEEVELVALDCGHTFCTDCWPSHIKAQIEQSKYLISNSSEIS